MLHAVQPWLPLTHPELPTEPVVEQPDGAPRRKARRKPAAEAQAAAGSPDQRAARQAYLGLVVRWSLSGAEALTLLGELLSGETERGERLTALLGAHRSLLLIAPEPVRCAALLRQPEPAFGGASLLHVMLGRSLPGIGEVRAHLVARVA